MKNAAILSSILLSVSAAIAEHNPDWWKSLELEPVSTNDLGLAATQLRQQERIIWLLDGPEFVAADAVAATNLWSVLAILHGDLRNKRIDNLPLVFRNFGIITNQVELQSRIANNEEAKKIRCYASLQRSVEERIELVFVNAVTSEALASFPTCERNAIVSNIVETARLTQAEAAALGLTNVVDSVGQ